MVLSLAFIIAFVGAAVALLIGITVFSQVSDSLVCPAGDEIIIEGTNTLNGVDNSTAPLTLGTLNAAGTYHIPDTNNTARASMVINSSGILNEAIFQDGDVDGINRAEIRLGTPANKDQWNFFHQANTGSNLTSINFWINGDVSGGADYPILDSIELVEVGVSSGNGLTLFTANGETWLFVLFDDNSVGDTAPDEPADDGQWHMVSAVYDKGNFTGTLQDFGYVCIDATCYTLSQSQALVATSNDANSTLTIGSRHDFNGNVVENKFSVDDLAVWNGYLLTQSDINTLYNGGSGTAVDDTSIGSGSIVAYYTFDLDQGSSSEQTRQECENAKDTAWTVIGIIPVALFFALFAIFGALGRTN